MTNYFVENMNFLLKRTGLSPYALAERLGIDPTTAYRWFNPEVKSLPRARTRLMLSQFFGVDPERLIKERFTDETIFEIEETSHKKRAKRISGTAIPLMKNDVGLTFASFFDDDVGLNREDLTPMAEQWLPPAPESDLNNETLVAIRAHGNAMLPVIRDGDLVYIDFFFGQISAGNNGTCNNNDIVLGVAVSGNDEPQPPILRRLMYGDSEKDQYLVADNPDWPGTKSVKAQTILGKVVAIFRKLPS